MIGDRGSQLGRGLHRQYSSASLLSRFRDTARVRRAGEFVHQVIESPLHHQPIRLGGDTETAWHRQST